MAVVMVKIITIEYFISKDKMLEKYNNITTLSSILTDLDFIDKVASYSPAILQNYQYSNMESGCNENVCGAFIHCCNFATDTISVG